MPYIGRSMSENALKAHQDGLFVKSEVSAQFLKRYDFKYSVKYFKWLIDKKYIKPVEFHHTSACHKMTRFYSPKVINFINNNFNLDILYKLYLKKTTKEEVIKMLNIKYVRLILYAVLNDQHIECLYDCIRCAEKLFWDKSTIIISTSKNVKIIEEFSERPSNWNNTNTKSIIKTLMTYKEPDIKKRIY